MAGVLNALVGCVAAQGELFKTVTVGNSGSETGYRVGSYGSIVPNQLAGGRTLIRARSLLLANFEIELSGSVGSFTFTKLEVQNSGGALVTLLRTDASFFSTGTPTFGWSWGDGSAGLWVPGDAGTTKQLRIYL